MEISIAKDNILVVNGTELHFRGKYLSGESYDKPCVVGQKEFIDLQTIVDRINAGIEYPFQIHPFEYNGFYGSVERNNLVNYTAKFIKWTNDPGVAIMLCSDGKERLIPTYAIIGYELFPEQTTKDILFGIPSSSN